MISKAARILESGLSLIGMRNVVSKGIREPKRGKRFEEPPKSLYKKYVISCNTICGRKCVSLKTSEGAEKHILYFHGGAYTMQAQGIHWHIVENILSGTRSEITFINYPLAPECTCADTMAMVLDAYSALCKADERDIILMGDSSGGGLALALSQHIKVQGLQPKPKKIILFSPWLDVSMDNNISKEQEKNDLILSKEIMKKAGEMYAGVYDTKDYRCSPLYGDMTGIGDVALFIGTSEILHTQAVQLRDKLKSHGQRVSYYEYNQMQHVWIGFPIPEAKEAMKQVISFIESETVDD
jgi:acetyl esterase/lipase